MHFYSYTSMANTINIIAPRIVTQEMVEIVSILQMMLCTKYCNIPPIFFSSVQLLKLIAPNLKPTYELLLKMLKRQ